MNHVRIANAVASKAGERPQTTAQDYLAQFESMLVEPSVREYLTYCLVERVYTASGVRVSSRDALVWENLRRASPGLFIYPHGYLVVATSIGGNAVCLDAAESRVVWAAHDSFFDDLISFKDDGGQWRELTEYSRDSVSRAVRLISTDIEAFLEDLLHDRAQEHLERLDH